MTVQWLACVENICSGKNSFNIDWSDPYSDDHIVTNVRCITSWVERLNYQYKAITFLLAWVFASRMGM